MRGRLILLLVPTIIIAGAFLLLQPKEASFPKESLKEASKFMKVYYYTSSPPHDFILDTDSISVAGGLLTFQLENKKQQKVVFSEQALPDELRNSKVESGEKVDGGAGSATVTFKEGRAIGTLLTQDKQTMVIANSQDGVGTDVMKDLIRYLKPL